MKWYHWVAIALGAYLLFFRKKGSWTGGNANPTLPPQYSAAITAITVTQDPGNSAQYDTDAKNYSLVSDQGAYPGWYRSNKDGSWYNPETGDFYSAGSSPVAYGPSYYDLHPEARPQIDLTKSFAPPPIPGAPVIDYSTYNIA